MCITSCFQVNDWPRSNSEYAMHVHYLLDEIDRQVPAKISFIGAIKNDLNVEHVAPPDFHTNPPITWIWARTIAKHVLKITGLTALLFGTQTTRITSSWKIPGATVLVWQRTDRKKYLIRDVSLMHAVKLKNLFRGTAFEGMDPSACSFLAFIHPMAGEDTHNRVLPDLSDISRIEEEEDCPDSPQQPPPPAPIVGPTTDAPPWFHFP